jgi:uncharacterized protein YjbJ (UPF0337 family)
LRFPSDHHKPEISKMDKDRIVGSGKQIVGSIMEVVGKVVGDAKLQTDGRAEKEEGKAQNIAGGLKDSVSETKPPVQPEQPKLPS